MKLPPPSAVWLWVALALTGCATTPPPPPLPPPVARLSLVNLTDYAWSVTLRTEGDQRVHRTVRLAPRETADLACPGSQYQVEQARLGPNDTVEAIRRFPLKLEPGQSYQWPLATLLGSAADADPANSGTTPR